jgi:Tol biopolymer transport system component
MAIKSETRLGPYEIVSAIGAGGMGEVYRARDPRLKREVAIKVLPSSFSSDPQRLHRFEQEAIAAGALNHPNILAVHDIGQQDGSPYIVSELLDGATLRERLRSGPLPIRKAVDYGQQIASGLAAAHDKGIVHRDLKPENIFVTNDGRVKILDFGLAKLTRSEGSESGEALTQTVQSDPGTVLGTVGYMSPEQVRGKPADARSDLFSFGAILYEMLSGKRAFHGESPAETMSAIVKEEPPELTETNRSVPLALERIVRHCLEKNPTERFQSARDIAFDLEMVSSVSSTTLTPLITPQAKRKRLTMIAALAVGAVVVFMAGVLLERLTRPAASVPHYRQLTFRRGTVRAAKFAPDGQILYSAAWDGNPIELYATGSAGRGGTNSGVQDSDIQAISSTGELLLISNRRVARFGAFVGTLARAPSGAAPRPILEDVQNADWGPDGSSIAVARYQGQRFRLEYPIGKVLYETATGWITYPRVSPKGDLVAFFEHPYLGDDAGVVSVVDLEGHKRTLTPQWGSERSSAWTLAGDEIWFTATTGGIALDLYGVSLSGKLRPILRLPGDLRLMDIGHDGRVLITQGQRRTAVMISAPGQKSERDLAVADWCQARALSNDGQWALLEEEAEGTESGAYTIYLRKADGSPPLRLGQGYYGVDLSRDRKWALVMTQATPEQLHMLPTGAGELRQITHDAMRRRDACLFPDGKRVAFVGIEAGHQPRVYIQGTEDAAPPRPITPEGVAGAIACSPVGDSVAVSGDQLLIMPANGGSPNAIPNTDGTESIAGWSANGQSLYTFHRGELRAKLYRVAIASGEHVLVKEIAPADAAGADRVRRIHTTPDLSAYMYSFARDLNQLYLVEGLK